ncbi:MAG: hypothetical protein RLY43_2149 [Bacteroidota bacterium]|jgi:hypothetical protein
MPIFDLIDLVSNDEMDYDLVETIDYNAMAEKEAMQSMYEIGMETF